MENYIVKKSISINATPEQVWDALTNPEKTKKYFFNSAVLSDWIPGHPITFKGKLFYFINYALHGEILEVEPQKKLKYNLKNSKTSGISIVTDIITYQNGVSLLSITDDVGQGEGAEKRYNRSLKGWDKILKGLKKLVESETNSG